MAPEERATHVSWIILLMWMPDGVALAAALALRSETDVELNVSTVSPVDVTLGVMEACCA